MILKTRIFNIIFSIYILLSYYETYLNDFFGFTRLILLLLIFFMLVFYSFRFKYYLLGPLLWLLLKIISISWASGSLFFDSSIIKSHLLNNIIMVLFVVLIGATKTLKASYFLKINIYSSLSMGILALLYSTPYQNYTNRYVLTLNNVQIDPNNLAIFLLVGISIGLLYLYEKKYVFISMLTLVINSIGLFMTGSRGGFLTYLLMLLLFAILLIFKSNRKAIYITLLLIFFSITFFAIREIIPYETIQRIISFSEYDDGSHRTVLWNNAFDMFYTKPLFGQGWGGFNYELGLHNTYLTVLIEIGLVGFLIFLTFVLIRPVTYLIKKRKFGHIIVLVSVLFPIFFIDAINKRFFWNIILYIFLLYQMNDLKKYSSERNISL